MFFNLRKFNIRALFNKNKTKRNKSAANKLKAEESKLADQLTNNAVKILKEYGFVKANRKIMKNQTMKKKHHP